MKFPLQKTLKTSLTASLILATAGLAHADPDLEKARTLFPAFSKAVYTDEDKADEIYETLSNLSPTVQQRLMTWLDDQFEKKSAEYAKAKTGDSFGMRTPSPSDARKIKELQQQLEQIRGMKDENAMKKVLQETGWSALKELLRLNGSTITSLGNTSLSGPDPEKAQAARKQAQQVGEYRYKLRKKLKQSVTDVSSEIDEIAKKASSTGEAAAIRANFKAASVLKENERFKGKIPAKEYTGILELNHWRIALGLNPLLIDPKLNDASRDHCKDMERLNFFAHESPVKGKKSPWDRAAKFGTSARGENIAINNSTSAANQAWFFSPGHHKNMFKADFRIIGLGVHNRHYCQLFR